VAGGGRYFGLRFPWRRRQRQPPTAPHLRIGEWGEEAAARALADKGYRIVGRRVRPGRRLELDLVARDGDCLVFVEVKTRGSDRFGRPAAAVDRAKRRLLSRAAVRFLMRLRPRPATFRFDVVEIIGDPDSGIQDIRHIVNAFPLEGGYRAPW
jgi:putative endonuclease